MAALKWDEQGQKIYETGDKKCVLYVMDTDPEHIGEYKDGVAWNGITAISSNDSGAEETALWADDIKYAVLRSAPEYGGTIEAYQCPVEFYQCDGSATLLDGGVIVGQQGRIGFGLSYVTTIGNDVMGTDYGYKIHLVWGCSASPSERSYQTINDSPDAMTLSWEFTTTPVSIDGYPELKPTSHLVIDSTQFPLESDGEGGYVKNSKLVALEEMLYGTDGDGTSEGSAPTLPDPGTVIDMLSTVEDNG